MCGVAQYHVMEGNLKIIVVFNQPEESPFFLAEPRTSTERLELTQLTAASAEPPAPGCPTAALIIRAPSKGCPAHVDVVQLLLDKGVGG